MDFDLAIKAHSSWKIKLQNYLEKPDGSIDVDQLQRDNVCDLGCWLHGPDTLAYKNLPEFQELIKEHKAFHAAAADIVRRKDKGENITEDIALGAKSPFSAHSSRVIVLLMGLRQKVKS